MYAKMRNFLGLLYLPFAFASQYSQDYLTNTVDSLRLENETIKKVCSNQVLKMHTFLDRFFPDLRIRFFWYRINRSSCCWLFWVSPESSSRGWIWLNEFFSYLRICFLDFLFVLSDSKNLHGFDFVLHLFIKWTDFLGFVNQTHLYYC